MEPCAGAESLRFKKKHAIISYWLLKVSLQLKFCDKCSPYMMSVLIWALCVGGLASAKMVRQELQICGTVKDLNILWQQPVIFSRKELADWSVTIAASLREKSFVSDIIADVRSFHIIRNVKVTSTSHNGPENYHPIYFKYAYSYLTATTRTDVVWICVFKISHLII